MYGERPFEVRQGDKASNFWPLAILSFGESWHNLHHADPTCARHGVLRGQIDISARIDLAVREDRRGVRRAVAEPPRADRTRQRLGWQDGRVTDRASRRRARGWHADGAPQQRAVRGREHAGDVRVRMSAAQRREQLIAIGRQLFAERGFDATSIEEVAARAKVSKPVVYEHFGGKEGLYAVVVDREVRALLDRITTALTAGHPRELLEQAALALLDYIEEETDGFRVLVRESPVLSADRQLLQRAQRRRAPGRAHPGRRVQEPRATTRSSPSSTRRRWSAWWR